MHPHTFLRTQMRNVLREWDQNSRKHSIYTHFPKDRNCAKSASRTKMTRALCRRRTGEALPRPEKSLMSDCESAELIARYAVNVQEGATQWIQSYPCKTNKVVVREILPLNEICSSSWIRVHKPKDIYTGEFRKVFTKSSSKIYHGIIELQHHIRSETNGIAERADTHEWKKVLLQYCSQSGLDEKVVVRFWWDAVAICQTSKTFLTEEENSVWKTIWRTIQRAQNTFFWSTDWIPSDFTSRFRQDFINLARKYDLVSFLGMNWPRGEIGKEIFWLRIWKIWKSSTHQKFIIEESTRKTCW